MNWRGVAVRAIALAGMVPFVCHTAPAQNSYWTTVQPAAASSPPGATWTRPIEWNLPSDRGLPTAWYSPWAIPVGFAFRPMLAPPPTPRGILSESEWRVSEVAARNGDRDYLMVDKSLGRLIQFTNGVPVFVSRVLTGASLADRIPPEALSRTYAEQWDTRFRVTPAGRFTVSHGFDSVVGATLDINEIKGPDWSIAIHSTGSPSRDARLRSASEADKHITEGCVNVDPATMRRLTMLPGRHGRIPLYILPMDERLLTQFF